MRRLVCIASLFGLIGFLGPASFTPIAHAGTVNLHPLNGAHWQANEGPLPTTTQGTADVDPADQGLVGTLQPLDVHVSAAAVTGFEGQPTSAIQHLGLGSLAEGAGWDPCVRVAITSPDGAEDEVTLTARDTQAASPIDGLPGWTAYAWDGQLPDGTIRAIEFGVHAAETRDLPVRFVLDLITVNDLTWASAGDNSWQPAPWADDQNPYDQGGPIQSQSVLGTWAGFFTSTDASHRGEATLQVTSQDQRRVTGEVLGLSDGPIQVEGTIAEGQLSLVGSSAAVRSFAAEGSVEEAVWIDPDADTEGAPSRLRGPGEGAPPIVWESRYEATYADGGHASGKIAAIKRLPNPDAPSLAGEWFENATSNEATVEPGEPFAYLSDSEGWVAGSLGLDTPDGSRFFDLVGQVWSQDGSTFVTSLGLAEVDDDGIDFVEGMIGIRLRYTTADGSQYLDGAYRTLFGTGQNSEEGTVSLVRCDARPCGTESTAP